MIFRPSLAGGGADRITLTLLKQIPRDEFQITLALARSEGALLDEIPSDVRVLNLNAPRLALASPLLALAVKRHRPDVVFSTSSGANVVACAGVLPLPNRPRLVLSERSTLSRGKSLRRRSELLLKRLLYPRAELTTCVSEGVAQELRTKLQLPASKVRTVFNPVVTDDMQELAAEPVEHPWFQDLSVPVIVAVGRLVALKDYPTLLRAFGLIRKSTPARLVILGDGPDRNELEALASSSGLGDSVHFAGFVKNPFRFMAKSRLLMHASTIEGLPGALIQAMACGTPVVSTDCDHGPREVIDEPGVNGYLVPVGDATALAEKACLLLRDEVHYQSMVRAGQESSRRFGVRASLSRYVSAISGEPRD